MLMILGYAVICGRRRLILLPVRHICGCRVLAVQGTVVYTCLAVARATLLGRA
jgi:hypothetical protein